MSAHDCHALNCSASVPPRMHMCAKHWRMVPKALQDALWANYRRGQERTKTPSVGYLHAAAACVRAVAEKEGQPPDDIDFECGLYETWADYISEEQK